MCQSYVRRKNRGRIDTSSRSMSGMRLDGMLREISDRTHEYCAIESATTQLGGSASTKALNDKAKLMKVQREMLSRQVSEANHNEGIVRKLQVVGISTAGLTLQVSRLCHVKGYVSLMMTHDPQVVPTDMRQFSSFLILLATVVKIKVWNPTSRPASIGQWLTSTSDHYSTLHRGFPKSGPGQHDAVIASSRFQGWGVRG